MHFLGKCSKALVTQNVMPAYVHFQSSEKVGQIPNYIFKPQLTY